MEIRRKQKKIGIQVGCKRKAGFYERTKTNTKKLDVIKYKNGKIGVEQKRKTKIETIINCDINRCN